MEGIFSNDEEFDDDESDSSSDSDDEDQENLPSTVVAICIRNERTGQDSVYLTLLDSGTNRSMGTAEAIHKAGLHLKRGRKHKYTTTAGTFTTTQKSKIHKHRILELNSRRVLKPHTVQVTPGTLGRYDFIFGRDYLSKYGIDLRFSQGVIEWDGAQMDMKPAEEVCKQDIDIQACLEEVDETDVIEQFWNEHYAQQIMDSKYEKTDLL
jgi:hypothetical protein